MNSRDRVLTALDHKEPDTVPITELSIDPVHIKSILGGSFNEPISTQTPTSANRKIETSEVEMKVRAYRALGFELVPCELSVPDGWKSQIRRDGTTTDEWGRILSYDSLAKNWTPTDCLFHSPDDFDMFPFPDPLAAGRTFAIEETKRQLGAEAVVAGVIKDPFAVVWEMFKVTNFVRWLFEKPDFIVRVIGQVTDFNLEMIKRLAEIKVDLIVCDGDYCEKRGPLVPVKFFKGVILPNLRKQVEAAHRAGLKFIKHTDGNLDPILQDLAGIVDGLHSLDPSAGMNIESVKHLYGDRLVLMGNVSVDNLCRRSVEEIVEETKRCLRIAAPRGGYLLTSSNSWYADAKFENCLAMVETGRKFGRYPINARAA